MTTSSFKIIALREQPLAAALATCADPAQIARYWRRHIATEPDYSPDRENRKP